MSSTLDVTAINAVLKQRYTKKKLNTITFNDRPFYAMVPKDTKGGGKNLVVGIRNALPQTRSVTFSAAQASYASAAGPSQYNNWTINWFSDYATANISGPAIDQASGDENALIDAVTMETDGALESLANSCSIGMYHNGGGARGLVGAATNVATGVLVLGNPDDVTNFALNQAIQISSDDGTGGAGVVAGTPGYGFVVGIDYDLGTLTISATLGGAAGVLSTMFTGITAGTYYVFGQGDYNGMFAGLAGWLPNTAPGAADSFYGLNRSKDPTKLAGVRVTGAGGAYEETLIQAQVRAGRMGAKLSHVFCNPTDWGVLDKSQQGRVNYNRVTSFDDPEIGFKSITVTGPRGPVDVIADVYCPTGKFYAVQMDTWQFVSMGEVPRFIEEDGLRMLRSATSDAYEVRCVYRGALACTAPGWNVAGTW